MAENMTPAVGDTSSPQLEPSNRQPRLLMRNISKSFGVVRALSGVDFEVYDGEVVGLVGDNGAGKSTLIKTISGVGPADEGEIFVAGQPVKIMEDECLKLSGLQIGPVSSQERSVIEFGASIDLVRDTADGIAELLRLASAGLFLGLKRCTLLFLTPCRNSAVDEGGTFVAIALRFHSSRSPDEFQGARSTGQRDTQLLTRHGQKAQSPVISREPIRCGDDEGSKLPRLDVCPVPGKEWPLPYISSPLPDAISFVMRPMA